MVHTSHTTFIIALFVLFSCTKQPKQNQAISDELRKQEILEYFKRPKSQAMLSNAQHFLAEAETLFEKDDPVLIKMRNAVSKWEEDEKSRPQELNRSSNYSRNSDINEKIQLRQLTIDALDMPGSKSRWSGKGKDLTTLYCKGGNVDAKFAFHFFTRPKSELMTLYDRLGFKSLCFEGPTFEKCFNKADALYIYDGK